jgi:hypothetical protein
VLIDRATASDHPKRTANSVEKDNSMNGDLFGGASDSAKGKAAGEGGSPAADTAAAGPAKSDDLESTGSRSEPAIAEDRGSSRGTAESKGDLGSAQPSKREQETATPVEPIDAALTSDPEPPDEGGEEEAERDAEEAFQSAAAQLTLPMLQQLGAPPFHDPRQRAHYYRLLVTLREETGARTLRQMLDVSLAAIKVVETQQVQRAKYVTISVNKQAGANEVLEPGYNEGLARRARTVMNGMEAASLFDDANDRMIDRGLAPPDSRSYRKSADQAIRLAKAELDKQGLGPQALDDQVFGLHLDHLDRLDQLADRQVAQRVAALKRAAQPPQGHSGSAGDRLQKGDSE